MDVNVENSEHTFTNALIYSRVVKIMFISLACAVIIFTAFVIFIVGIIDGHFDYNDLLFPGVLRLITESLVFLIVLLFIYKYTTSGRLSVNENHFIYSQFLRKVKIKWADIDRVEKSPRNDPKTLIFFSGAKRVGLSKYLIDCNSSRRIIHNPLRRYWIEESCEPFPMDLEHSVALWVVKKYRPDLARGLS